MASGRAAGREPGNFPQYSRAERRADLALHVMGVAGALGGAGWMLLGPGLERDPGTWLTLCAYVLGLVAAFGASAAYNLTPPGRRKERLRRLDHAAIYLLIAASYTPFAFRWIPPPLGPWLGAGVWAAALLGVALKLCFPRRFERLGLALYLAIGWAVLLAVEPLTQSVRPATLWLLLGGGALYTAGTLFHTMRRLPFHNAIWHGFVLLAAACHFLAIGLQVAAA